MPALGDQHMNHGYAITNPFEETKPRISEYTAQEIASLQSRLEKQLGPEYISSRPGPSGQKVHYVAAEKCIQLANEVFGFNGWSSSIVRLEIDFADEILPQGKFSVGIAVTIRVTLRDGTFHEDIGYGKCENKSKAAAFEKARKEATTDGLKRALRNFGNVLGNCIYDREYLAKVTKVKLPPTKWDVNALHRHSDYATVKKDVEAQPAGVVKQNDSASVFDALDDEFGDFDDTYFGVDHDTDSECRPDEVTLPTGVSSNTTSTNRPSNISGLGEGPIPKIPQNPSPIKNGPLAKHGQNALPRAQNINFSFEAKDESYPNHPSNQPQTPNVGFARSNNEAGSFAQTKQQGSTALQSGPRRLPNQPNQSNQSNQPNHANRTSAPTPLQNISLNDELGDPGPKQPQNVGASTFYSARAASLLPEVSDSEMPPPIPGNLPLFNPHAESPSIRKTPGIDHNRSKPLSRELKHIPGSVQSMNTPAPIMRPNIVNPQLDGMRKIGAPGIPSPMANRATYRPPTMKRPNDGANATTRPPLGDKSSNNGVPNSGVPTSGGSNNSGSNNGVPMANYGNDAKRQKVTSY